MKQILYIVVLLIPSLLCGQLKVEWQEELPITGRGFISITRIEKQADRYLFAVATDKGSTMFEFGNSMRPQSSYTVFSYLTHLDIRHAGYYTKDHCNVKFRNFNNEVLKEHCFQLEPNWPATSPVSAFTDRFLYHAEWDSFLKFDLEGNLIYRKQIGELVNSQVISTGGPFIYLYSRIEKPALGPRLMQYDTLGNQKWSLPMGDVRAMLADKEGNCYVAAVDVESTLIKYNTTGEVIWSKPVTGQFIEGMSKRGDSIFVCGRLKLGSPENQLCAYSIMSAKTGEILQQQSFSIYQPATVPEHFSQIASDGENIYVGGVYGGQYKTCFLLKLSREGNTTGLRDEKGTRTSFNIFPNPGGSKFTITCDNKANNSVNVTVRNISGQIIYNRKVECNLDKSFTLDLGKQAAGNYSVEIVSDSDKITKKVIIE